jgi:TPR repeat protein
MSEPDMNIEETQKDAMEGNPMSQFNLAIMYATGQGMSQDNDMAKKYFRLAAEQGLKRAQMNLGSMYSRDGDMVNALKYYQMGADQGQRECMKIVGYYYYEGIGGAEKNHVRAFEWYKKAADLGNSDAMLNLAHMYDDGEGTAVDKKKALKLYLKNARENDDPDSQFMAACMLILGSAGTKNLSMAVELCQQSMANGYQGAHVLWATLQEGES